MKIKITLIAILASTIMTLKLSAQNEVDVADITLKVGGLSTEEIYFGFAEGDKIVFSMIEKNGKDLKEVTITEYPNSIKFQDRSTAKIENKIFNVARKGIYKFSFYNSNVSGRVVNLILKRIPSKPETKDFNTNIVFRNVIDTAYIAEDKQFLVSSDTSFVDVLNSNAMVHSTTNSEGPRTVLDFTLPANTFRWAYWIGVGKEGDEAYKQDQNSVINSGVKFLSTINPMAGLLLGALTLTKSSVGENVEFWFIGDNESAINFKAGKQFLQYKKGNVITDNGVMQPRQGRQYIGLSNDNMLQGISVNVKITAMVVKNKYETRNVKTPVVTNKQIPFNE